MTKKRVFVVHGWGGSPKGDWLPWLKKRLEGKGFSVKAPAMPDTENPRIRPWVEQLAKAVGKPDVDTYFVGHSIGCQTILRYIAKLPRSTRVGGVVLVAGWLDLKKAAYETEQDVKLMQPWIKTPVNWAAIKKRAGKFVVIYSDNDPFVSLRNAEVLRKKLGACKVREHHKGHFSQGIGTIKALPSALRAVIEMAESQ